MKPSNSHKKLIVNNPPHNKTPLQEWAGQQRGKTVNGKKVIAVTCWDNGRGVWLHFDDGTTKPKVKP